MTLYQMLKKIISDGTPFDQSMHCQYCRKQGSHHPHCVWALAGEYVSKQEAGNE